MDAFIRALKISILLSILAIAVGCSEVNAPTASLQSDDAVSSSQYPPLDNIIANLEAAGYRAVNPPVQSRLDDHECDSIIVERYARINQGGSVNLQGLVRLEWDPGVIPDNMTLQIVAPSNCIGAADFYPHPTSFNGYVSIIWDISALELPEDFNFDSLVPLYIHDDGTPEEVIYSWRGNHDKLVVETNHFSRYIISTRIAY